jgi:hypothetical protein
MNLVWLHTGWLRLPLYVPACLYLVAVPLENTVTLTVTMCCILSRPASVYSTCLTLATYSTFKL